ncbi:MAG: hypothetical protein GY861_16950 [bacterium]|nr:hypothetical protein [bacterium]
MTDEDKKTKLTKMTAPKGVAADMEVCYQGSKIEANVTSYKIEVSANTTHPVTRKLIEDIKNETKTKDKEPAVPVEAKPKD